MHPFGCGSGALGSSLLFRVTQPFPCPECVWRNAGLPLVEVLGNRLWRPSCPCHFLQVGKRETESEARERWSGVGLPAGSSHTEAWEFD